MKKTLLLFLLIVLFPKYATAKEPYYNLGKMQVISFNQKVNFDPKSESFSIGFTAGITGSTFIIIYLPENYELQSDLSFAKLPFDSSRKLYPYKHCYLNTQHLANKFFTFKITKTGLTPSEQTATLEVGLYPLVEGLCTNPEKAP